VKNGHACKETKGRWREERQVEGKKESSEKWNKIKIWKEGTKKESKKRSLREIIFGS
jgi:hypothetical protein